MKRLIQISLPLMLITTTLVIILLELSGYPGTMNDTQLGFNAEIIKAHSSNSEPDRAISSLFLDSWSYLASRIRRY